MILQLGLTHASNAASCLVSTLLDHDEPRHVISVDDAATPEAVARCALEGAMAAQWLIKAACCHPTAARAAQRGEDCAVRFVYNPNTNDSTIIHIVRGGKNNNQRKNNKVHRRKKRLRAQRTIPQLVIELCLKDSAREDTGASDALPVMASSPLGLFRDLGNPVVQGSIRVTNNGSSSLVDEEDIDTKILRVYQKDGYPDVASHAHFVEVGIGTVRNGADVLALEADSEDVDDDHDVTGSDDDSDDDDNDLGPLARSDARFVPHVRQANIRKEKRTPNLRERIESPPTRREMAAAILEASIDPFQSRIITPQKLDNDETDSIESSGDWSSDGEDTLLKASPAAPSAGVARQRPKRGTIEEINDANFRVPKKIEAKFHACETVEEKRAVLAAFRKRGREAVARSKLRKEALRKSGSHRQLQLEATRTTTSKESTRKRKKRKRKSQIS